MSLAHHAVVPDEPNGIVLFCVPGGGMDRHYFDLRATDEAGTFSMADHLAARGFTVVCIDHPGVGDSPPPDDEWALTPQYVRDRDAEAVAELKRQYAGIAIGVGHSMGSMLQLMVQAEHRAYDALGLLGWAFTDDYAQTELAAQLSDEERQLIGDREGADANVVALAKMRFGQPRPVGTTDASPFLLGGMAVTQTGLDVVKSCRSNMLAVCGLYSMLKPNADEVRAVDVPVFIGVGENDIAGDARSTSKLMRSCRDITIYELAGAGHNQNIAPNRHDLWDRLGDYAISVASALTRS